MVCISLRRYDILDVRSVLVLRKATTISLYLNIHRRRSRPGNQSLPASTDAPIEVTTSTYIVFTNDLQIVYNNKITGLKNIIIIMFITCLFYTDLGLNIYIDIESINFKIKFSEMIN
jgi:hypothetical protein